MEEPTTIVVMEDDLELGIRISTALEQAGYDVSRHASADTAIEFIEDNAVDLIVTDIFIKSGNEIAQTGGLTLISRYAKLRDKPIPTIAISGSFKNMYHSYEAESTARTVGASATLAKPFTDDELRSEVKRLLRLSKRKT